MFQNKRHNHGGCIKGSMKSAATLCKARGANFTVLRSRILELIWQSHKPTGAYELLDMLRRERPNAQPPTVYRALVFLLDLGLIHRIESLNAYVGCSTPNNYHSSQFLICSGCGAASEVSDAQFNKTIHKLAEDNGFLVNHLTIEIEGQCPNCQTP